MIKAIILLIKLVILSFENEITNLESVLFAILLCYLIVFIMRSLNEKDKTF